MKKIMAIILSFALMISSYPVTVLALDEDSEQNVELAALDDDEVSGQYTTWQSATVLQNGQSGSFVLDTYNSSLTDNQMWFAVTVDRDDQAIELSIEAAKDMYAYVYSGTTLASADPTEFNYLQGWGYFSGSKTYSLKVDHAGVYYILLRARGTGYTTSDSGSVQFSLLDGDANEDNDTPENATELTENVNTYFTLHGENDVDWFKITTTVPGDAIKLYFSNFDYTVADISAYLYTESDDNTGFQKEVINWTHFSEDGSISYKANEAGTYYLKIVPYAASAYVTKALKVRYEIVSGDSQEINDTYDAATKIPYSYNMEFTLNGNNDVDWFYFETTQSNEVVYLYLNGFETDYSNHVSFQVFDAKETAYNTTELYSASNVTITYSKAMTFSQVGGHYIKIWRNTGAAVENTLTLRLEQGTTDAQEPNDTWKDATLLEESVSMQYNLPSTSDVDWFVFSTTEPNQTVELTSWLPSGGATWMALYSEADFTEKGDSAGYLAGWWPGSGTGTYRYMLSDVGQYYVKITVSGSSIFEDFGTITYNLIEPDANERNNTWKTATVLNEDIATSYTLPATNDVDWFVFSTTEPNQTVELTSWLPSGGATWMALYSEADFTEKGDSAGYLAGWWPGSGTGTYRYMLSDVGQYYVKITVSGSSIFEDFGTITYNLIDPDANERNNTWKTATVLNEDIATSYTLPATNDVDWFVFSTTEPNQTVELTSWLPSGGATWMALYSEADFTEKGDSAGYLAGWWPGSGTGTYRYMLSDVGQYYVKITVSGSSIFEDFGTITYNLIEPDANERNNTSATATPLSAQNVITLTLPASNDEDWFALDPVTASDKITVTLRNIPNNSSVTCGLYVLAEGAASVTQKDWCSLSTNSTKTWTISTAGTYYLKLYTSSSTMDAVLSLKYAIIQDDVSVTGISSITNGNSTIFQGKALQLYANVIPANATNQTVTWTSSNTNVATIDENGFVTGVAVGSTTITATTVDGNYTVTTQITVAEPVPVTGVTVTAGDVGKRGETEGNPYPLSLNTSIPLSASALPETATERDVIWSVSDEKVLAVNKYGKVYAVGSGSAYVTVTTVDGSYTANFYFDVPDESYPVKSISLSLNATTIYMEENGVDLTATVNPSYATNPTVIWSSDNESVATVDQNGHVTPVSAGYATITVTAYENSAVTATCQVSVQPVRTRVQTISFEKDTIDVGVYGTVTLQPIIEPYNATDTSVTWASNNKTVATVSRNGVVTAMNIGQATITATTKDGGLVATVTIKVSSTASVGDINNDGIPDAGDALLVLRYSVGLQALSTAQKAVADVNGDGSIDAGDAILLLRYDAGLIDKFPVEK